MSGEKPIASECPQRRVVIAEDDELVRWDLAEMLAELGWTVAGQAADGDSALALINELRPDLAVLDVKMPEPDGIAVASKVVAERICAVIILTGYDDEGLLAEAARAGAMSYLVKPADKARLKPAIEIAVSRFDEARRLAGEVESLAERLEVRIVLDRAKGILMDRRGLSEDEAFRWIQRTAQDTRKKMRTVAELIVDEEQNL